MAYAQSAVTLKQYVRGGRRHWHATFTESEVAAASTFSIAGLPVVGTITLVRVDPVFTTGTTVRPAFGRAVGWTIGNTDINHIGQVGSAATAINDGTNLRYTGLTSGVLYGRTVPDGGSDTTTTWELTVVEGHL